MLLSVIFSMWNDIIVMSAHHDCNMYPVVNTFYVDSTCLLACGDLQLFIPGDTPFNSRQLIIARVSKVTLLNGSEVSDCVWVGVG